MSWLQKLRGKAKKASPQPSQAEQLQTAAKSEVTVDAEPPPQLHFDTARTLEQRDEFEFQPLGERLARSIGALLKSQSGSSSFVVGLEGRWGSGKSTILNYIKANLEAALDPRTEFIIEFDPWWLEEGANIPSSLLRAVLSTLPQAQAEKSLIVLGRLAAAADRVPEGFDLLLKLSKRTEKIGEMVEALKKSGGDLGKMLLANKPTRQLREDVAKVFKESGVRFVVFIDDLDRLSPTQALQVMAAIRSIADLPGFVYILAYDPRALANILKSASPPLGHDYFDKIVNISVPVPPVTFEQIKAFTLGLLAEVLRAPLQAKEAAQHQQALFSLLDAPRDAVRLANAVNFWLGAKTNEVFIPDFVLLEAIRLSRPSTYDGLLATSDVWLGQSDNDNLSRILGSDQDKEGRRTEVAARVDRELGLTDGADDAKLKASLSVLFPAAASFLGEGHGFTDQFGSGPTDERRIENRRHFFTYFLHRPLPGAATKAELSSLIDPALSYDERLAQLGLLISRPTGDVDPTSFVLSLIEAEDERGAVELRVALELVRALSAVTLDKGNSAAVTDRVITDLDLVRGFAARTFKRAGRLSDAEVDALFLPSHAISLLGSLFLVLTVGTSAYLLDDKGGERVVSISDEALALITERLMDRIDGAIATGEIYGSPIAPRLLHMAFKNDPARLKARLSPVFAGGEPLLQLVESYSGYHNPIGALVSYSDLKPNELKQRVADAMLSSGLDPATWAGWKWFKRLIEADFPPVA